MRFGVIETVLSTTAPESVTDASDAGFDGIELDVAGPDPGDDPLWSPAARDRTRRRAAALDVAVPSVCLGFLNREGLTADDPDVRADARMAMRRAVDAAAAVGADVVLVPFFSDAAIESDRHRDRVVDGVARVADSAQAAGVTLALENTLSGVDNRALLDRIDSPAVGVYYDVGNAVAYGLDPVEDIRTLGDDIARVHVKDWGSDGSCPVGDGEVDFQACADALAEVGYDDWLVLETATPTDPLSDAAADLRRTRERFG